MARSGLPARAQAVRLILKRAHHDAQPMINPQPLPPCGDDATHPLLNPQPLPPHGDDGLQLA